MNVILQSTVLLYILAISVVVGPHPGKGGKVAFKPSSLRQGHSFIPKGTLEEDEEAHNLRSVLRKRSDAKGKRQGETLARERARQEQGQFNTAVNTDLEYPFRVLEMKFRVNSSLGHKSGDKFLASLRRGDYWDASQAYMSADWSLPWTSIVSLRREADPLLDGKQIDVGKLGFGWRENYVALRNNFYIRREDAIEAIRSGEDMTAEEIVEALTEPGWTDVRPDCEKFVEAAEVLAEAGQFKRAEKVVVDYCGSMDRNRVAVLLGGFAAGMEHFLTPKNKEETLYVMNVVNNRWSKEYQKSPELQVALASLYENLKRILTERHPQPAPFHEAMKYFVDNFQTIEHLQEATVENMSEILWQSKREFVHFLPIIEEVYNLQAASSDLSFYMLARLLAQYYIRRRDTWLAYKWSLEALVMRPSLEENEWMKVANLNIRKAGALDVYFLVDSVEGHDAFVAIQKDLAKWTGKPNFTPQVRRHFTINHTEKAIEATRKALRGLVERAKVANKDQPAKKYSWAVRQGNPEDALKTNWKEGKAEKFDKVDIQKHSAKMKQAKEARKSKQERIDRGLIDDV